MTGDLPSNQVDMTGCSSYLGGKQGRKPRPRVVDGKSSYIVMLGKAGPSPCLSLPTYQIERHTLFETLLALEI